MEVTRDWRKWQLEGDLRQALENYFGGVVTGPWDKVITALAETVEAGHLNLEMAAHLNLLLQRTTADSPDTCAVCDCPYPDQAHR
jgi:hypothetical protein